MSNYMIGKNAVTAIDQESIINKFLLPEIPVGDTYPSWDGEILVYSSIESRNKRTKSDIIGRVPVQVKGNHVERFSEDECKFNIEVADLKNYSNDAGALFFVVEMTDMIDVNKTKIFYAELLNSDIYSIIKGKENQKTISHTFQELPTNRLYSLCQHFLYHRKEQGFKMVKWNGKIEYDEYIFTIIGNRESDFNFYLFDSGTYIYGVDKHSNLKVPLSKFKADIKIEQVDFYIGTKSNVFYNKIYREKTREGKRTKFGKSFTIVLSGEDKLNITFKESGSIKERIKDCEFFLEITKNKNIYLNNTEIPLNFTDSKTKAILDSIPKYIIELKNILKVFDYMGVDPKEDLDEFKEDVNQIQFLKDVILNRNIDANKITDKQFQLIRIGKYKFLLAKSSNINNNNIFFNFFNYDELVERYRIVASPDKTLENSVEHSPYVLLKPNDLYEFDNLNLKAIEKSLMNIDYTNSMASEISNDFLINTLFYLDENQNNKDNEILTMVAHVFEYIHKQTDDDIYFINSMQAIHRKRKFTADEISKIVEMKNEIKEDDIITWGLSNKVCKSLLLKVL